MLVILDVALPRLWLHRPCGLDLNRKLPLLNTTSVVFRLALFVLAHVGLEAIGYRVIGSRKDLTGHFIG
jgi:hypothetical protein